MTSGPTGLRWRLTSRFTARSRASRFDRFMHVMDPQPNDRLLDVGVIDTSWRSSNFLENRYPWPEKITAVGLSEMPAFRVAFPLVPLVVADGRDLPFDNRAFDIGFSNAVIEHVGNREQQRRFVGELLRTCRRVFISTPNARFPVDPHTLLPFVHWLPFPARRAILGALGNDSYGREEILNPVSARELRSLFPPRAQVRLIHQRVLGLSYLLTAVGSLDPDR